MGFAPHSGKFPPGSNFPWDTLRQHRHQFSKTGLSLSFHKYSDVMSYMQSGIGEYDACSLITHSQYGGGDTQRSSITC